MKNRKKKLLLLSINVKIVWKFGNVAYIKIWIDVSWNYKFSENIKYS